MHQTPDNAADDRAAATTTERPGQSTVSLTFQGSARPATIGSPLRPGSGAPTDDLGRITPQPALGVKLIRRALIDAPLPDDPQTLRPLFESILRWGVLQPLVVCSRGSRFELLAGRRRYAAAAAAGLAQLPCIVCDLADDEAQQLAADLNPSSREESKNVRVPAVQAGPAAELLDEMRAGMSALSTGLRLLDYSAGGLRHDIARRLVDMEIQRAAWTLDALRIHCRPLDPGHAAGAVAVPPLLHAVAQAFEPECRLARIDLTESIESPGLTAAGDGRDLATVLSVVTGAVLTLLQCAGVPSAALTLVARRRGDFAVVSIEQNVLPPELCAIERRGRPEGFGPTTRARLGLQAARKAVETWGGRLELRAEGPVGAFDLKVPLAQVGPDDGVMVR